MDELRKLMAAAAYDRCLDDPALRRGTCFALVSISPNWQRMVLCSVAPHDPVPAQLRGAFDCALSLLRGIWIAMLREDDATLQAQLCEAHASLQHDVLIAEHAWEKRNADPRAIAAFIGDACAGRHALMARRPPHGPGIVVPGRSRASEAYPAPLRAACQELRRVIEELDEERVSGYDRVAASDANVRRVRVEQECYAAIGSWRLGEADATRVAAEIAVKVDAAAIGSSSVRLVRGDLARARASGE